MKKNIIVSACLLGINCKYNGDSNYNEALIEFLKTHNFDLIIPVCPEQLGGLTTPRPASELVGFDAKSVLNGLGKIMNIKHEDVSKPFIKGAYESLKLAKLFSCSCAILKERSPSCGSKMIYTGNFDGTLKIGKGITTQLFEDSNIQVFNEDNFTLILNP